MENYKLKASSIKDEKGNNYVLEDEDVEEVNLTRSTPSTNPITSRTTLAGAANTDSFELLGLLLGAKLLTDLANTPQPQRKLNRPLHDAVWNNDLPKVKSLLKAGHPIDSEDEQLNTPLNIAIRRGGDMEIFKYLIQSGANINGIEYRSPLFLATAYNDIDMVKYLVEKGSSLTFNNKLEFDLDQFEASALHLAFFAKMTKTEQEKFMKYLKLCFGKNKMKLKLTAFHFAAVSDASLPILKYFMEDDTVIKEKSLDLDLDSYSFSPLHCAAANGQFETVKYLVDKIARDDESSNDAGRSSSIHFPININAGDKIMTALHVATFLGHLPIIKLLLENHANPNSFDTRNRTPLHLAAGDNYVGFIECVKILIKHGSHVNAFDNINQTPLHLAAVNNLEFVKLLVGNGAAVHATDYLNGTPLHFALNEDIASFLIESGANSNAKDSFCATPLILAAHTGKLEVVKYLTTLEKVDINAMAKIGTFKYSALHAAAMMGHIEILTFLIEAGANLNFLPEVVTPLHLAAAAAFKDMVKPVECLVRNGANLNAIYEGNSPLHEAIKSKNVKIAQYLIEVGTNVNLVTTKSNASPLYLATESDLSEIVKLLVENNADISIGTKTGWTPFVAAIKNKNYELVKFLAEQGSDINVEFDFKAGLKKDPSSLDFTMDQLNWIVKAQSDSEWIGKVEASLGVRFPEEMLEILTEIDEKDKIKNSDFLEQPTKPEKSEAVTKNIIQPLHLAARTGSLEIVRFLIEQGANLNVASSLYDSTPLMWAVAYSKNAPAAADIVKYMIEQGSDVNGKYRKFGTTALHCAARDGKLEIVRVLVNNGNADINQRCNAYNMTALDYAAESGELPVVMFLVVKGAQILPMPPAATDDNGKPIIFSTPLHYAATFGHLETVTYLLRKGSIIDALDKDELTAFELASINGHLEVVKFLYKNGAKVREGNPVLNWAARNGYLDLVEYFIEGLRLDKNEKLKNRGGYDALHDAVISNNWDIVKYLTKDDQSYPLHEAASTGNIKQVEIILKRGTHSVDDITGIEFTPLQLSVHAGHLEIAQVLIDNGANVLAKNFHASVLHFATVSKTNRPEMLKFILDKIKSLENGKLLLEVIDVGDCDGDTPLMWAIEGGHTDSLKILLDYGASMTVKNHSGMKAMDWAKKVNNKEVLDVLKEYHNVNDNSSITCSEQVDEIDETKSNPTSLIKESPKQSSKPNEEVIAFSGTTEVDSHVVKKKGQKCRFCSVV